MPPLRPCRQVSRLSRSTIPHSSMTFLMRMSPVGDLNAGIAAPSKLMCENGLGGRAGRFISPASMAGQRRPQRCSCTKRRATARMPRPIRFFAAAVCIERCWRSGLPMPLSPVLILCAVVLIFFPRAIATWNGPACGCSSSERYGRKRVDARVVGCPLPSFAGASEKAETSIQHFYVQHPVVDADSDGFR